MNIDVVILAAGYSSRMNGFKPLMTLGGKTLLAHCVKIFRNAGLNSITVVTGYRGQEVEAEAARLDVQWLRNSDIDRGMFSSVYEAVQRMQQNDGFFLHPVDIPLFYPATVSRLLDCFDGHSVLLPVFCGRSGHPPLIPACVIPAILAHNGAGGLQAVLEQQPCLEIDVWDKGILMDADTPEDFSVLKRRSVGIGIADSDESLELARQLMSEKGVEHGVATAKIAMEVGRRLNTKKGYNLNLDIIRNAALLHDVGKGTSGHESHGGEMLHRLGLHEIAKIVAAHRSMPPPVTGILSEKEVVCLADKLVKGSRPVSVQQRFAEKLVCYAHDPEAKEAILGRRADIMALQAMVERQAGSTTDEMIAAANIV